MRYLWMALMTGLLFACAPSPEKLPGDQAIERWIGRPMTAVVAAWGEPGEEIKQEGVTLYRYPATQYRPSSQAANLPPETTTNAYRDKKHLECAGVFSVDSQGIVTAAAWQGYECWALP